MTIKIIGNIAVGNGRNGISLNSGDDVELIGNIIKDSRYDAVRVYPQSSIMQQLGLPEDTDPRELAQLLDTLRNLPEGSRQAEVGRSGLFQRWATAGMNVISLGANLVTVAGAANVQELIKKLIG